MKKYDILQNSFASAFYCFEKSTKWLFRFGYGASLLVFKKNRLSESFCSQTNDRYKYDDVPNILCGQHHFTPKRFVVIQMK